jgi:hypothetical protein
MNSFTTNPAKSSGAGCHNTCTCMHTAPVGRCRGVQVRRTKENFVTLCPV